MVTIEQLVEHVRASLSAPESGFKSACVDVGNLLLEAIVRATLAGIDHHVNTQTGEVYSPVPPPSNIFPAPERRTDKAYWSGGRRRRGGRR